MKKCKFAFAVLLLNQTCSFPVSVTAAAHPHRGLLPPYEGSEARSIKLTNQQDQILLSGQSVKVSEKKGNGGRGFVIQDVHAPPQVIWERILDFPGYTEMVPRVKSCDNYFLETFSDGSKNIKTAMTVSVLGAKINYFIEHKFQPDDQCLTWTLDYDRRSDLEESVGYWFVQGHPDPELSSTGWSRVYYSVDVVTPSWLPGAVKQVMQGQALTQATAWVKKYSESQFIEEMKEKKAQAEASFSNQCESALFLLQYTLQQQEEVLQKELGRSFEALQNTADANLHRLNDFVDKNGLTSTLNVLSKDLQSKSEEIALLATHACQVAARNVNEGQQFLGKVSEDLQGQSQKLLDQAKRAATSGIPSTASLANYLRKGI